MADTSLRSILDTMLKSPLATHAQHIGFLCLFWSRIELWLGGILWGLMEPIDEHVAAITITNMSFSEKISAALALGFQRRPSDEWFKTLKKTLDEIDNDLRPQRNRFVHDHWIAGGDEVLKVTLRTGVYRQQAREYALKLYEIKETKSSDVLVLCAKVMAAGGQMMELIDQLVASRGIRGRLAPEASPNSNQTPEAPAFPREPSQE